MVSPGLSAALGLLSLALALVSSAPVIDAPWGRVSGKDLTVAGGSASFYAYLGIPFALPPVGERRFKKPEPHPGPGVGQVFNASSPGYVCPQQGVAADIMNEDCLTLDVYTPAVSSANGSYPVMVWIHGGGYVLGSALLFTPGKLVTQGDVIVVVIQYRLGIVGFLSTGDDVSPGNYGLLDQNLALHWVKDNIRAFGGNPDSMTIFGESAGGGSVGFQHLSPYSKGLFSRAIFQSGTPLAPWSLNKSPRKSLYMLANKTGCMRPGESNPPAWVRWYAQYDPTCLENWTEKLHKRIVACLREVSVDKFVPLSIFLDDPMDMLTNAALPWVPTVDKDFVPQDPAKLVLDPEYLVEHGIASRDVMHGVNNNEGLMMVDILEAGGDLTVTDDDVRATLASSLKYEYGEDVAKKEQVMCALTDVLSFFYTQPRKDGQINVQAAADIFSDINFVVPMMTTVRSLSNSTTAIKAHSPNSPLGRTYVYLFDHYPAYRGSGEFQGMDHGHDLFFEFDNITFFPTVTASVFTAEDLALKDSFVAMVTEFAKTGNPNNGVGRQLNGTVWPEFSNTNPSYLAFAPQPRVEKDLYAKRVGLWLDLVPTLFNRTRVKQSTDPFAWWLQDGGRWRKKKERRGDRKWWDFLF